MGAEGKINELESLVVKVIGDQVHYDKMLASVVKKANEVAKKLETMGQKITQKQSKLMVEAGRVMMLHELRLRSTNENLPNSI